MPKGTRQHLQKLKVLHLVCQLLLRPKLSRERIKIFHFSFTPSNVFETQSKFPTVCRLRQHLTSFEICQIGSTQRTSYLLTSSRESLLPPKSIVLTSSKIDVILPFVNVGVPLGLRNGVGWGKGQDQVSLRPSPTDPVKWLKVKK